ncbi:MAG: 50S ribosomal protein L11 methyltransferase [Chromatiaceae bacterium]|nr:50S ribosomal protein L11 methyltransferase [Chromatiaceae bacterium]
MPWIQVTCSCDRERAPLIEVILENAGALAVTLRDAADDPQMEPPPGVTPLWSRVRLTALFPDSRRARVSAQTLLDYLATQPDLEPRLERIQDQIWERAWMDDFAPARFGKRLWICPRGQAAFDSDAVVVEMNPGLAFGTGHHPTTALCLRWLDGADLAGKAVIDYGCGSGILAIAALRLGAVKAMAIDHDPQALEATRANAEHNRVADRLLLCLPERMPNEPADLLLANILAGPLVELAPRLSVLVRFDGSIALSGIIREQSAQIEDAYRPWFELEAPRMQGEWALLSGRRKPDVSITK